jgi:hypothetical protein
MGAFFLRLLWRDRSKIVKAVLVVVGFTMLLIAIGAKEVASFIICIIIWSLIYFSLLGIWIGIMDPRFSGCVFGIISFFACLMVFPVVAGLLSSLFISWLGLPWPFDYPTGYWDYPERGTGPFRW